jgi:hypothetical protein
VRSEACREDRGEERARGRRGRRCLSHIGGSLMLLTRDPKLAIYPGIPNIPRLCISATSRACKTPRGHTRVPVELWGKDWAATWQWAENPTSKDERMVA